MVGIRLLLAIVVTIATVAVAPSATTMAASLKALIVDG